MKNSRLSWWRRSSLGSRKGFTLIELLVVIAIISILAAMVFPISKALNRNKLRTRARGELAQIETGIQSFKAKTGVYPPDNPDSFIVNPLYYELVGTVLTNKGGVQYYRTLDGSSEIQATPATIQAIFGSRVSGFINTARPAAGDEATGGQNFLKGLRENQIGELDTGARVLVTSVGWPAELAYQPVSTRKGLNPWRYNSSNPTNNPGSYDLWIDVMIDGKTNRISNWSKEPLLNVK